MGLEMTQNAAKWMNEHRDQTTARFFRKTKDKAYVDFVAQYFKPFPPRRRFGASNNGWADIIRRMDVSQTRCCPDTCAVVDTSLGLPIRNGWLEAGLHVRSSNRNRHHRRRHVRIRATLASLG